MMDEQTAEKIEQLASETVIKISNMAQSGAGEMSKAVQRELTKLRLTESVKMTKKFLKVYEVFRSASAKTD